MYTNARLALKIELEIYAAFHFHGHSLRISFDWQNLNQTFNGISKCMQEVQKCTSAQVLGKK